MEFLRAFWAEFWGPNSYYIAVPMAVVGTIALWIWYTDPRQVERRALRRAFRNAGRAEPAPVETFDDKQPTMTEAEAMAWVLRTRAELAAKSDAAQAPAPPVPAPTPAPAAPPALRPAVAATQAAVAQLRAPFDYTPRGDLAAVPILHDGTQFHTIDLTRPEDMVVAGMKRHGKGNLLQLIALEVLHAGPSRANLVVLDMKLGVDYSFVRQLDHSLLFVNDAVADSTTDEIPRDGTITEGLKRLKAEMHRRYALMIRCGARNLPEHNARAAEPLPYLYVIADEVAEFTAAQKDIAEELARVGGGAGIICFWATQRPEANVLSMQIQGNTTRRVVFRLAYARDHYISLRIPENTQPQYDLTAITMPGIAVLRVDGGKDHLGRVPTVSDTVRDQAVAQLLERWPRSEVPSWLADLPEDEAAPTDAFVDQVVAVLESLPESEWKKNTIFRKLWPNVATPGGRKLQKLNAVWSEAIERVKEAEAA